MKPRAIGGIYASNCLLVRSRAQTRIVIVIVAAARHYGGGSVRV